VLGGNFNLANTQIREETQGALVHMQTEGEITPGPRRLCAQLVAGFRRPRHLAGSGSAPGFFAGVDELATFQIFGRAGMSGSQGRQGIPTQLSLGQFECLL
jgi:hypothetical protein